jgi:septum site-determining protein MinC
MKSSVGIKGTRTGLVVTLAEDPPLDEVVGELGLRLRHGAAFFRDARITLNLGARTLSAAQLVSLRDLCASQGVTLQHVAVASEGARQAVRAAGLTVAPAPQAHQAAKADGREAAADKDEHTGMLIKRTLRSGVSVRHPSHVVLLGDLHAGAEIIAGGDIVVWGALRGIAHAGALGDEAAGIYALYMAPTQLRIGGQVARPPEHSGDEGCPEQAKVRDGRIMVEAWVRPR